MSLPSSLFHSLRLPLIAAPMLRVSGPDLVIAACRNGVIGAFPTANCQDVGELGHWLTLIETALAQEDGPVAPFCHAVIAFDVLQQ